jgi:hypothetical protein
MESFETKGFTSKMWLLPKTNCMVTILIVRNGFAMSKVCNEITCMDFSKFWTLVCNSKWHPPNHFNITWKFCEFLMFHVKSMKLEKTLIPWFCRIKKKKIHKDYSIWYVHFSNVNVVFGKDDYFCKYTNLHFWLIKNTLSKSYYGFKIDPS